MYTQFSIPATIGRNIHPTDLKIVVRKKSWKRVQCWHTVDITGLTMRVLIETLIWMFTLPIVLISSSNDDFCDQRPLGAETEPLPPDNTFKIDILEANDEYIPTRIYTVRLYSTDKVSTFIAFTISALGDTKENEKNPDKPLMLDPGDVIPTVDGSSIKNPRCNNSVKESDITPKTYAEAHWKAPPKDNKCVTIYALLAVRQDVWYNYEGPLSKRVCEDIRKAEDMMPTINDDCSVCEDARYMVTFEGLWSYNTHPWMFPKTRELARFSDVVGASHSKNFQLYKFEASEGLKMLAAQGNTTKLEIEIREKLGISVRTIIKATSQLKPDITTNAIFRTSPEHHLVSLVTGIIPSPDWFLGVSNMELCDIRTNKWATNLTLNLYPLDAGIDSGLSFESANEETIPPQSISLAVVNKTIPKEQTKPFARVRFDLIRTYNTLNCATDNTPPDQIPPTENRSDHVLDNTSDNTSDRTSEKATVIESEDESDDCPVTQWEEWSPCTGICTDNSFQGFHFRERYHIIDGVPVRKYKENSPNYANKEVSQYCLDKHNAVDIESCTSTCDEEA